MDRHTAIKSLQEAHTALQSIYDARDRIHLISDGYGCAIPHESIHMLAKIAKHLNDALYMLEQELGE